MSPLHITSLQHPLIKHLVKLRKDRSYRQEQRRLLLQGRKLIDELLPYLVIHKILYTKAEEKPHPCKEIFLITPEIGEKIAGLPASYLAEVELPPEMDLSKSQKILVCDRIQDPGNLGTLFRSAVAFGMDGVFLLEGSVDLFNDKVVRAAKGAQFLLPYRFGTPSDLLPFYATHSVYLADLMGNELAQTAFQTPLLLILGNEGGGVDPELKKGALSLTIPMTEKMESLNVSIAGSIFMYQIAYGI